MPSLLPTVREIPKDIRCEHEFHMRVRKSMIIAFELFWNHFDGQLTASGIDNISATTMADAARAADQRPPGGPETESLIRALLHQIRNAHDTGLVGATGSAIEQAVAAARANGSPVILVLPDNQ
ncbi:hypothetical protein ACIQVO_38655 [Streptomyces sp. NPDC101062]|uniref:hypothetical protein n=1 Tax=unclassified Streptomyces TaxID=2593676 RepID=UPI00380114E6